MLIGDQVRLIGIPPNVTDDEEFPTLTLFQKCLGKTFVIRELQNVDGLLHPLFQLDVGHIIGIEDYMESIYVEPQFLQVVSPDSQ